jgi:hypothetical protein
LLTLGFLLLSVVLAVAVGYVARAIGNLPIPVLSSLVARLLSLYAPMVMARQLGLLLREHGEEL